MTVGSVVRALVGAGIALALAACAPPTAPTGAASAQPSAPAAPAASMGLLDFPPEARVSDGGGEPRSAAYWLIWNGCAQENQAETARANGGRDAGWILVDDLLEDPGMSVGGQPVGTCEQALRILAPQGTVRLATPADRLRAELLTAELNRAAGAEGCLGVDVTLDLAQDVLGAASASDDEPDAAIVDRLVGTLGEYNQGLLCK